MPELLKQLLEIILKIFTLFVERFLKPGWLLLFSLIFIIWINFSNILKTISALSLPQLTLVNSYLNTFLSWPIVILIVVLFFIFKFSQSIKIFLENSKLTNAGPLGVTTNSPSTPQGTTDTAIEPAIDQSDTYEFAFLNNVALVYNTKQALFWIYTQPNKSTTRELFLSSYQLPPIILNPGIEKEAQLVALVRYGLLEDGGTRLTVTTKGEKFLRYANIIN